MQLDPMRRARIAMAFDDHPLLAIWELTQACDLVCAHCRACATTERDTGELTTAEGKRLLDTIAAMSIPLVVLTGGDPAKRPDLVELVAHGSALGLTMAVTPSGTPLFVEETVKELKAAGLARLAISIDGPDAATHDAFRGVEGSFAETMRIVEAARRAAIPLQINTSVGPHNAKSLRAMADMVAALGAVLWGVFFVVPTGRAGVDLLLGPRRVETLLEELAEIADSAPFDVKTTAAPHYRRVLMQRKAKHTNVGVLDDLDPDGAVRGLRGINDGSGFLFVSHTGDIYPSGFLPVSAGNVRVDDLATVYRTHPLFQSLRDETALGGKCGICPFRRVCGGSRARAFAVYGDVLAEDPLCAYVPKPLRQ
jgi:radical SAM protein